MSLFFVSWPVRYERKLDSWVECEPDEAERWGIYRRAGNPKRWGRATHICDVADEDDAIAVVKILNTFMLAED